MSHRELTRDQLAEQQGSRLAYKDMEEMKQPTEEQQQRGQTVGEQKQLGLQPTHTTGPSQELGPHGRSGESSVIEHEVSRGHAIRHGGEGALKGESTIPSGAGVTGVSETREAEARALGTERHGSEHGKEIRSEAEEKVGGRPTGTSLHVVDVGGSVVMNIDPEDVKHKSVGWLRHALKQHIPVTRSGSGEPDLSEMQIYSNHGEWLSDEVQLNTIKGDHLFMKCYRPHGDIPFNLNLKLIPSVPPDRVLTVEVRDNVTIGELKDKITEWIRIPAIHQRILFAEKELQDSHTIAHYKLPAESTCELRLSA